MRAERARNGSKRRRDQEALAEVQGSNPYPVPAGTKPPRDESIAAWGVVREQIRALFPDTTTFGLWIRPLELAGEHKGALVLVGPPAVGTWVRRRYAAIIGELTREHTDFTGIFACDKPAELVDERGPH